MAKTPKKQNRQPGIEANMDPAPEYIKPGYAGSRKLLNKVATAMKRAGQPSEPGPAYVFLASDDASFITGQVIHVNGGEAVNG